MSLSFEQNQTIYNNFQIQKKISSSKYSVYRAFNSNQTEVALKLFPNHSDGPIHFQRESSLIKKFNHPNIISSIDSVDLSSSKMDENSYISLQFAKYGDLLEIVTNNGHMEESLARTVFLQLLSGLSHMHSVGVAHLDLKVDNILVDENFNVKITDFDLSQELEDEKKDYPLGMRRGTPGCRAPEVQDGTCKNFLAADIYSLGVILFILVTGHPPYSEKSVYGVDQYDGFYKAFRMSNSKFWAAHAKHKGNSEFYCEEFKDLFHWMLAENARERPSFEEIRNHSWIQREVLGENEFKKALKSYMKA